MANAYTRKLRYRSLFQFFGILGKLQGFHNFLYVAVHYFGKVINGEAYTVLGQTALGIIIGTHFGRTVAGLFAASVSDRKRHQPLAHSDPAGLHDRMAALRNRAR